MADEEFRSVHPAAHGIIASAMVEQARKVVECAVKDIAPDDPLLGDALPPAARASELLRQAGESIDEMRRVASNASASEIVASLKSKPKPTLTALDGGQR